MSVDIAVVGSLNYDLTIQAPRHPRPGETVLGSTHYTANGGKGANQALAAARLGSAVAMIGAVGDDDQGRGLISALAAEGVDTSGVISRAGSPTGLAVITVDDQAENTIVVSPGANQSLTPDDVEANAETVISASVLLVQLEVPVETVQAAIALAKGTVCLNPAPFQPLPSVLLEAVDVLIPNRSELAGLAGGVEPETTEEVIAAAESLRFDGAVAVTLGAEGSVLVQDGRVDLLHAPEVSAVDPTGAGDAFCGALASGLAAGADLRSAVRRASLAGAIAATRPGAQPSLPTSAEVDGFTSP